MRLCANIPVLAPVPVSINGVDSFASSQPIMQLKELEVDLIRYNAWKASLQKPKRKR